MTRVTLEALNAMPVAHFVSALAGVFEHSPWIAEATAAQRPFASTEDLFSAMRTALSEADSRAQMALILAHPDLAGKAAQAGELTSESTSEQTGVGLDRLSQADYARFTSLNRAYKERFGLPFILCVRRHTRDSILVQFERRLGNDFAEERDTALGEIARIAALRLDDLVDGPEPLRVHGRLSTHVLDTQSGRPAAGLALELVELSVSGRPRLIAQGTTNADGRTDQPLIQGRPLPIGTYELRFDVGNYFAAQEAGLPEPAFLGTVPVRFSIAEPEGHYHVPLLVTPWSYQTYRGS